MRRYNIPMDIFDDYNNEYEIGIEKDTTYVLNK